MADTATDDPRDGELPHDRHRDAGRPGEPTRDELTHDERTTHDERVTDERAHERTVIEEVRPATPQEQASAFGGIKWGSAFFGWLAAMGLTVLLTALASAIGAVIGVSTHTDLKEATASVDNAVDTIGIAGGIVIAVILFVAYACGGYVAGRMARFHGLRQGFAVWVWAVVIAVIVAVVATLAGAKYDVLSNLNGFPRLPIDQGNVTTGGAIALLVAVVVALLGSVIGGLTGMRYHRRVDRMETVA